MHKKKLTADSRISWPLAFCGWLVLLLIPLALLQLSFENYDRFIYERKVAAKKQFLFNELSFFVDDLSVQNWLQKKFSLFNRSFDKGFSTASETRKGLEKSFQLKVAFVLQQDLQSGRITYSLNKPNNYSFKAPPKMFVKRFFRLLKNWPKMDEVKRRNSPELRLFRTFFGNIEEFFVPSGKVMKSISTKFGNTGPIYLQFFRDAADKNAYLAVIKEEDIKPERIIKDAVSASTKDLQRKIFLTNTVFNVKSGQHIKPMTRFTENSQGIEVRRLLPADFMVYLVQRGGIVPHGLNHYLKNLPAISVFCSKEKLQGNLSGYRRSLGFACKIILMLGSLIFLRLAIWGANFRLGIATKVFVALALAALFPVAIFVFAYSSFSEYEKTNQIQQAQRVLRQKIATIKKAFNSGIKQVEVENVKLAVKLQQSKDEKTQKEISNSFLRDVELGLTYVKDFNGKKSVTISKKLLPEERWDPHEMRAFEVYVFQIFEMLRLSPKMDKQPGISLSKALNDIPSNRTGINNLLESVGKLQNIDKLVKKFWLACVLIFDSKKLESRKPQAIVFPGFHVKRLMQKQLQKVLKQFPLKERRADWQIDLAFVLKEGKSLTLNPQHRSSRLSESEVLSKARIANVLQHELIWELSQANGVEMVVADESLPYLCFARINQVQQRDSFFAAGGLTLSFYLALLAIMVLAVAGTFFVAPVKKIASGMRHVGTGTLDFHFSAATGDEFDQLSESLNSMLKGLKEKRVLAEYVSEDVKQAVSKKDKPEFEPGGESIAATIMFCEAPDFNDFALSNDPERVMGYLNNFFARVDEICQQHGGVIDKVVENSLMLVFRENSRLTNHALRGARAAMVISGHFNSACVDFPFQCKIGIASGTVISGKIGSKIGKLDFTVIGDTVNLAARLKSIAHKAKNSGILVSRDTAGFLQGAAEVNFVEAVAIKGKSGHQEVFELLEVTKA